MAKDTLEKVREDVEFIKSQLKALGVLAFQEITASEEIAPEENQTPDPVDPLKEGE